VAYWPKTLLNQRNNIADRSDRVFIIKILIIIQMFAGNQNGWQLCQTKLSFIEGFRFNLQAVGQNWTELRCRTDYAAEYPLTLI
jgi:hypothetical protein